MNLNQEDKDSRYKKYIKTREKMSVSPQPTAVTHESLRQADILKRIQNLNARYGNIQRKSDQQQPQVKKLDLKAMKQNLREDRPLKQIAQQQELHQDVFKKCSNLQNQNKKLKRQNDRLRGMLKQLGRAITELGDKI